MEKITKTFKHNYENDTTLEYFNTGLYAGLNCSYTSEDPAYGTDTLHYNSEPADTMEALAYEMHKEIAEYLDQTDDGMRHGGASRELDLVYGEYSNSTLYAIEKALAEITEGYTPPKQTKWFMTIEKASKMIAEKMLSHECDDFYFCMSCEEEKENFKPSSFKGECWYGIKRIPGFFDNSPSELIVACGYYGGGNCSFAYVWAEDTDTILPAETISKAICESTGGKPTDIIFIEEVEK